jgi:hypothetical protein
LRVAPLGQLQQLAHRRLREDVAVPNQHGSRRKARACPRNATGRTANTGLNYYINTESPIIDYFNNFSMLMVSISYQPLDTACAARRRDVRE